jgi:transposase
MKEKYNRLSTKGAEKRRLEAARLLRTGKSQSEIARILGVTRQAVHGWKVMLKEGGISALLAKQRKGRPLKAPKKAIEKLSKILEAGPMAYGFKTDIWTAERVCKVMEEEFGVRYNRSHMTRILHRCGLSWQKPTRKAAERNDKVVAKWRKTILPKLKKTS